MSNIRKNKYVGDRGERIGLSILGQALDCNIQKWIDDIGLEAPIEFRSTSPRNRPLHFSVQIKTGSSYAKDIGRHWQIRKIDKQHIDNWRSSKLPVIFLWVHPELAHTIYWHQITPKTSNRHFLISKARRITPSTKFDLTMKLENWERGKVNVELDLLGIPLSSGVRQFAKDFYKKLMKEPNPIHPLLGEVNISWSGWRHITNQSRKRRDIFHSLQLLPVLRWAIENPEMQLGFRRVKTVNIGRWTYEIRLLIFKTEVELSVRSDANVEYVIRETIRYPKDWIGVPNIMVYRYLSFESIYEKRKKN